MGLSGWKCTKCGMVTGGSSKPLVGVCNKGGGHKWTSYNPGTLAMYRCEKCGMINSSIGKLMDGRCPKGGSHTWRKDS